MLEIDYSNFPCRLERLISFIQVRGIHEASASVLKCSSTAVDMPEQMNLGLLLLDRRE
jgi:hypothetical protein